MPTYSYLYLSKNIVHVHIDGFVQCCVLMLLFLVDRSELRSTKLAKCPRLPCTSTVYTYESEIRQGWFFSLHMQNVIKKTITLGGRRG